ncbi:MAG: hypothetical protein A2W98_13510 [Bacteroidetes bacterium GWF2_33_38]|nr:MAG: hypothetical protein A2W98_13510 [Bacteroidetes bacterium GWF2_33_38]OFY91034.1 MAG: hypothetical protein A2236_09045 [Bacteroidetes bacterium RIFOXYA2_FULL_33_7]
MKTVLIYALVSILFIACSKEDESIIIPSYSEDNILKSESEKLIAYVEKYGNIIQDAKAPFLIDAEEINSNFKNSQYHIIDIRNTDFFQAGHIPGAKNVEFKNLLNYFSNNINPYMFQKIVIVCYSGQMSAYYSGLLRLAGYSNVYSMRWGMSSWNKDFAKDFWMKNTSNKYAPYFVKENTEKQAPQNLPEIKTDQKSASKILESRISYLFTEDAAFKANIEDVFANQNLYYILSFWSKSKYDAAHINGSVNYEPLKDLQLNTLLRTLPTDKQIVVYCGTGQYSAFVVAYLRTLGYDAKSVLFGANGMIYDKMKEYGWPVFNAEENVNDFEYAEGENDKNFFDELSVPVQTSKISSPATKSKSGENKKKSVQGGCS